MKQFILLLIFAAAVPYSAIAQVAISTNSAAADNSSMLDIQSTSKGLLIPRMTMEQRGAILSPATGLIIYQTDNNPGMYYYGGTGSPVWKLVGNNAGQWQTNGSDIYYTTGDVGIGTSNPADKLEVAGGDAVINGLTVGRGNGSVSSNTALGSDALISNTSGSYNTACGYHSLDQNSTGGYNASIGSYSLSSNTGSRNTACGYGALSLSTTGQDNVAVGYSSLNHNKGNSRSTSIGSSAMYYADNRITGRFTYNTAVGYEALKGSSIAGNNTGQYNTAVGDASLFSNTSGYDNTALGASSMWANTTGHNNTAIGYLSLENNDYGYRNTAIGLATLRASTTGYGNTAVGSSAGELFMYITNSVFIGRGAMADAEDLTNCIAIGYDRRSTASNQVRIGNTAMTSIGGAVDWSVISDRRFKTDINPDVPGLDFILKLQPVTYKFDVYKLAVTLGEDEVTDEHGNRITEELSDLDRQSRDEKAAITYTGFIAQDVETAARSIGFDFSGVDAPKNENDLYALRYAEFVVPLVKAVQEQQAMIEEQNTLIGELLRRIEILEAGR